jgi:prephenate dehydrogenase
MPKKSNQMRWIIALGGLGLIAVLLYSSFQQTHHKYEVCVTFKAGMHCATAAGASSTEAIRSAQDIDCQFLASGRDENMVCLEYPPTSVRELK